MTRKESLKNMMLEMAAIYKPAVKEKNRESFVNTLLNEYELKTKYLTDNEFYRVVAYIRENVDCFPYVKHIKKAIYEIKKQIAEELRTKAQNKERDLLNESYPALKEKFMRDIVEQFLVNLIKPDNLKKCFLHKGCQLEPGGKIMLARGYGKFIARAKTNDKNPEIQKQLDFIRSKGEQLSHPDSYYLINYNLMLKAFPERLQEYVDEGYEKEMLRLGKLKKNEPAPELEPAYQDDELPF